MKIKVKMLDAEDMFHEIDLVGEGDISIMEWISYLAKIRHKK